MRIRAGPIKLASSTDYIDRLNCSIIPHTDLYPYKLFKLPGNIVIEVKDSPVNIF